MLANWNSSVQKVHRYIFIALAVYLLIETVRVSFSAINIEYALPIIRWLVLFSLLIPLYFILQRISHRAYKHLPLLIVSFGLIYFSAYLLQGIISELNHISRFNSQGGSWPGSSYAVFPFLIILPVCIILLRHRISRNRALSLAMVALATITFFYYESRILEAMLLIFMAALWFVLDWRKALIFCGTVILTFFVLITYTTIIRSTDSTTPSISDSITIMDNKIDTAAIDAYINQPRNLVDDNLHDIDRVASIIAPLNTIKDKWTTLLFGYGTYQHHFVLQPFVQEIANTKGLDINIPTFVRTTGFAAFLTDYGIIGALLLFTNILFQGITLFLQRNKTTILFLLSLCIATGYLFVNNMLDNLLFWLLIIPLGILKQLNKT